MKTTTEACKYYNELISSAFDGIVQPTEIAGLLMHISECAKCLDFLKKCANSEKNIKKFNSYFASEKLPQNIKQNIMNKIQENASDQKDFEILDFEELDKIAAAGDINNNLYTNGVNDSIITQITK